MVQIHRSATVACGKETHACGFHTKQVFKLYGLRRTWTQRQYSRFQGKPRIKRRMRNRTACSKGEEVKVRKGDDLDERHRGFCVSKAISGALGNR